MSRKFVTIEIGKVFGQYTVIEYIGRDKYNKPVVIAKCSCGRECTINYFNLKNGHSTKCLSCRYKSQEIDRSGSHIGMLTAIQSTNKRQRGGIIWLWQCDCGNPELVEARFDYVSSGYIVCCKNCTKENKRKLFQPAYKILLEYRNGAKKRNLEWDLDSEDYFLEVIDSPCVFCGVSRSGGIDRIDSSKGYTRNNVQSCCQICNIMKNDYNQDQFLEHIKQIYRYITK